MARNLHPADRKWLLIAVVFAVGGFLARRGNHGTTPRLDIEKARPTPKLRAVSDDPNDTPAADPIPERPLRIVEPVSTHTAPEGTPSAEAELQPTPSGSGTPTDRPNLETVRGIGPKFAATLRSNGVMNLEQLAVTPADELTALLERSGMRAIAGVETWPQQAQALLAGDDPDTVS